LRADAETAIGPDRYEELRAQGGARDKDAALDALRAALDELDDASAR
jgi:hypothetical protein